MNKYIKGGVVLEGIIIKESIAVLIKLTGAFFNYIHINIIIQNNATPSLLKIAGIVKLTEIFFKVSLLIIKYNNDYTILNDEKKKLNMENMINDLKKKVNEEFSIHILEEFNVLYINDGVAVFQILKSCLDIYKSVDDEEMKIEFNIFEIKFVNFCNFDIDFIYKIENTVKQSLLYIKNLIQNDSDGEQISPKTDKERIKYYVNFFKIKLLEILHYYDEICMTSKYKKEDDIDKELLLTDIKNHIIFIITLKNEITNKKVKPENVETSLTVLSPSNSVTRRTYRGSVRFNRTRKNRKIRRRRRRHRIL